MTRDVLPTLPSGILVVAGLWLIASPFVLGAPADVAVWNSVIAGILIALLAGSEFWGAAKTHSLSALSGVLGVWVAVSPFVLGYSADRAWTWSSVVTGVVVFALGFIDVASWETASADAAVGRRARGGWAGGRHYPETAFEYEDRPSWERQRGAGRDAADGEFRGVGPKGWHRSDDDIKADVCMRMADHPRLDAREIDVVVLNGEVRLVGEVPTRAARRLAEDIAESVSGVSDVSNELRSRRAGDEVRRVA